ncbi:trypsin 3A1-like [Agrilus planipennis]|uniref:Trypsin 3A1-like n=1 Tax=Agrilus planipennis TaxID=224129 RepID=A0A7F5RAD7_AGRPL|nr:trypsin 3A1-like [Agrilus planipennis]
MKPTIVACLVFSLLGFSNYINAASIPSNAAASLPFDGEPVPSNAEKIPSFGRIVGGSEVDISNYPYQVALLYSSSQICGASIISHSWILTAAHCITSNTVSRYSIRAGSNFRYSGGVTRAAGNIYVHGSYTSASSSGYDIALIALQSALTFGGTINAVDLPSPNVNIPSGTNAITTGWGDTVEDGNGSSRLRGVTVPIVTNNECRSSYGNRITSTMLCAGFPSGGRDACQGDSGGPLVASGYGQVGIVSWGRGCARPNYYGVYSRVPALRNWITTVSGI